MADFVGNSRHPADFGLKELLWDNDEDGFWEYFSKFEEESRAELARNPFPFPIPPIVQVGASTSSRSSTASSTTPLPSTSKRDHHYHVLSEISNNNTPTRKRLNDEDLDRFIEQQKNKNTKRKTESDIRKWYQWCEEHGENREVKNIPQAELDRLLAHFFVTIKRKDGTLYEPDTLTSFQISIDRHLTRDLRQPYSILRDQEFTASRDALKAARKRLKSEGKGNKPNAADALESADVHVENVCGHLVHWETLILLHFSKPYGGLLPRTWEQEGEMNTTNCDLVISRATQLYMVMNMLT